MTAEEITGIINDELKSEPDIKNVFGLDLTKRLILPTRNHLKIYGLVIFEVSKLRAPWQV
jgi:hypothetical protein